MGGVQENAIYPIDGLPIFEKPDFVVRKFPDSWSAPQPQRVRSIAEHRPLTCYVRCAGASTQSTRSEPTESAST